jgi:NitT/TauT family transport system permease protein
MPSWLVKTGLVLAIATIWEIAGRLGHSIVFPPLSAVLAAMVSRFVSGDLGRQLEMSLLVLGGGLLATAIVAFGAGKLIRANEALRKAAALSVAALAAMPFLALVPLILIYFGYNDPASRVIAILICATFPMLDQLLREPASPSQPRFAFPIQRNEPVRATMAGAPVAIVESSGWDLPVAAPLRAAFTYGLSTLIFAEMVGSSSGLGFFIMRALTTFDLAAAEAGILVVGMVAAAGLATLSVGESQAAKLERRA